MTKISVVVNTRNEEKNIERCLKSVSWAEEIIVVDMESVDKTVALAKKMGAKTFTYRNRDYVEPARNFALSKASQDWILILDADEEFPLTLKEKLEAVIEENRFDFVRLSRKNIIFGKWIKHSRWWPDYNLRFFRKGVVKWSDKIHSIPETRGHGIDLAAKEEMALIHYNYQSVSQYLERLNRYSQIQARELMAEGYRFDWKDLLGKPIDEFISRFFAGQGYLDGIHGLALAFLQAISEGVKYLQVWEMEKFQQQELISVNREIEKQLNKISYWLARFAGGFKSIRLRLKAKI